ncbi:ABC transporter ATP-binding protein [Fodinicurvata sediminis]|uniref:ABC transporter ATP-binding protein n=1 Tax=Fodinicurvata sediminis TaxID=1121832 RepID=UPI0003B53C55|nr:ABC transporter ATP-binding protein [Fodinicurvata sediminis]
MTGSEYVLEAEGLTKQFRGFYAVNGVNLKVRRGSIHALIGPNGAGKTTVFNLLTKFLEPTSGRILYNGEDITRSGSAAIARKGMVRSFQISAVFPQLTTLENVRVALQRPTGLTHKFWKAEKVLDSMNEQAMELLEAVGLNDFAQVHAGELPYGRKRSLEIATTLALDPEFMLLDEPTAGMAHEDVSRVSALIKRVSKDRTILLVEHNLSVVSDLSDTITVLQRGEVLVEGDYETLTNNPDVREAYMGTGHA